MRELNETISKAPPNSCFESLGKWKATIIMTNTQEWRWFFFPSSLTSKPPAKFADLTTETCDCFCQDESSSSLSEQLHKSLTGFSTLTSSPSPTHQYVTAWMVCSVLTRYTYFPPMISHYALPGPLKPCLNWLLPPSLTSSCMAGPLTH